MSEQRRESDRDGRRSCSICGCEQLELLHRQEFILPGEVRTHYDVVACTVCGFTFARSLPTAEEYEAYYRSNLKYTYQGSRDASAALLEMYRGSFEMIDRELSTRSRDDARGSRILDIGCSTGELLALLKEGGYRHLVGADPTPECRNIARRLYGVDVRTAVLSELEPEEPYDAILLANVLEHIPDLKETVVRVEELLLNGGLLFVQVPDADHFGTDLNEPFFEFSIEHINYFTETSLANLLARAGLSRVELRHDVLRFKGTSYPVLTSVWRKRKRDYARVVSNPTPMRSYIARSRDRLEELTRKIDAIVESREPIVIWGVGSLTSRLLATTNLAQANITGFVDSNKAQQAKRILGRGIGPPSSLIGNAETVLIASFAYGAEIRRTLEEEIRFEGRIIMI